MVDRKRILLLHGYFGSQDSFFLPFLKKKLLREGHDVFCPSLPHSDKPILSAWVEVTQEWCSLGPVDLAICHSLGGTLAMSLVTQDLIDLKALVVIGSSFGPKDEAELNTFLVPSIDLKKIRQIKRLFAVSSFDDPWTHHEYSNLFVKQCGAVGLFFSNKGHFESETLPEEVMAMISLCLKESPELAALSG
jgi:predicted alpha/beta hydrolase family esterase